MNENQNFILGDLLRLNKLTISVAESLTGGSLGSSFVSVPGSSDYFHGGVIAYDNLVKINLLKVNREIIDTLGAVSEECAAEMAAGVRDLFNTDAAVSVTGIAGPGGATDKKPLGLVYAGFIIKNEKWVSKYLFSGSRCDIINKTVHATVNEIICKLKEKA